MNCKCGNPLTPEDKFCKKCGTPVVKQAAPAPAQTPVQAQAARPAQARTVAPAAQARPAVQQVVPTQAPAQAQARPVAQAPAMGQQMAQPMMTQPGMAPMGPAPMPYQQPPKKGTNPILMIVLALVAFAVGYFGYKLLSGGGSIVAAETASINIGGYAFDVPVDMKAEYDTTTVTLSNGKLNLVVGVLAGDYNKVSTNISGFTYEGEKTYNGTKYKLFSVKDGVHNAKAFYYSLASNRTGAVVVTVGSDETKVPSSKEMEAALKIATSAKASSYRSAKVGGMNEETIESAFKVITEETEEASTGDIMEDIYEDTYVNITLDEINE